MFYFEIKRFQLWKPDIYDNFRLKTMSDIAIISAWENKELGGLLSYFGGTNPPDERKEGVANVCYIL